MAVGENLSESDFPLKLRFARIQELSGKAKSISKPFRTTPEEPRSQFAFKSPAAF